MKTNGFDRPLRYFIQQAELYVIVTIGGSILMSAYIWLINNGISFSDIRNTIPASIFYVSTVMILSITTNCGQYWFPLLISFGCRRKNIFGGYLAMLVIFIFETSAIYQLSGIILHRKALPFPIITALTISLTVAGITTIFSIAMLRWGKIAYILMIFFIVATSMVFILRTELFDSDSLSLTISLADSWPAPRQLLLLIISAAVCAAANIMNYRTLSIYEIKA